MRVSTKCPTPPLPGKGRDSCVFRQYSPPHGWGFSLLRIRVAYSRYVNSGLRGRHVACRDGGEESFVVSWQAEKGSFFHEDPIRK